MSNADPVTSGAEARVVGSSPRPIFVLGPSRSGTSVVTRVINLLGAPLCVPEDLHTAPDNPDGHWESRSVIEVNEELIARAHGAWALPPSFEPDWWREPQWEALRDRARHDFTANHPDAGWVCKDPRLCLTLPFWLEALPEERPLMVLVLRRPEHIAQSLVNGGVPPAHALAMWERYTLAALHNLRGHRVAVISYEALQNDPLDVTRSAAARLAAAGAAVSVTRAMEAAGAVRPSSGPRSDSAVSGEVTRRHESLWALQQALPAWSDAFSVDVPTESSTTLELLRALTGVTWWSRQIGDVHDDLGGLLGRRPSSP